MIRLPRTPISNLIFQMQTYLFMNNYFHFNYTCFPLLLIANHSLFIIAFIRMDFAFLVIITFLFSYECSFSVTKVDIVSGSN